MSYCKYCGEQIKNDSEHNCQKKPNVFKVLSWLFDKSGVENPFRSKNEIYERGRSISPDCIALDEGEIPVKQYNIGILRSRARFQRSEGRLQITNKRVLFRATGYSPAGKTTYQHAFSLDKIDGVEIHKDRRFRFPDLLFVILWDAFAMLFSTIANGLIDSGLGIGVVGNIIMAVLVAVIGLGCGSYFFRKKDEFFKKLILTGIGKGFILGILTSIIDAMSDDALLALLIPSVIVWGLVYLIIAAFYYTSAFLVVIKPNLMIEIKTSSGSPGIQIKHREMSFIWHKCEEFSGFTEILPWDDTDLAIKEVATIIDDIKTLGDLGVEKWKEN